MRFLTSTLIAVLLTVESIAALPSADGREIIALKQFPNQRTRSSTLLRDRIARRRAARLGAPPSPTLPASPSGTAPVPRPSAAHKPYFQFHWKASADLPGEVDLPTPSPKPTVLIDGQKTFLPLSSASTRLANLYHIFLVDDEESWNTESATLLYEMLRRLPDTQFKWTAASQWRLHLTSKPLTSDVELLPRAPGSATRDVRISNGAFHRSNPTLQPGPDGSPDRVFYSNRLFRAVLRTFFSDRSLLEEAIKKRYGYSLGRGNPPDEYQDFSVDELQYLASVLEDLPGGFQNIYGLERLIRRRQGLTNPTYPQAPAIAWLENHELEFTDLAFTSGNAEYIQRLVAHEMSHFLWHYLLSKETQHQFMQLSGWEQQGPEKWTHATTTNFVSDYAAFKDPLEDFAEAIAYYIYNPDLVRTVAPTKYAFVRNVVDGYEYVILAEKRYTFRVFNIDPKTTFPGKIVGIDTEVSKMPDGSNGIVVFLHLSQKYGRGAEQAYTRIISPVGTYVDQYFSPVQGNTYLLRAEFTIPKDAASGYWIPEQITVKDKADNRRYEGQKQFGWLLHIQNDDEDREAPVADLDHITLVTEKTSEGQRIRISVPLSDAHSEGLGGYGTLTQEESGQSEFVHAEYDTKTRQLIFSFLIRSYRGGGIWSFREFTVTDNAGNERRYDLKERALSTTVTTTQPDTTKPELDLSSIKIVATPTHPETPNGETDVSIWYAARDDTAGLGWVSYTLLKPNGDSLFDYHYHDNFHTPVFVGDPRVWKTYRIDLTLPPGSIPGTWILRDITLKDKAGNILTSNFVEIGVLKKFDVQAK